MTTKKKTILTRWLLKNVHSILKQHRQLASSVKGKKFCTQLSKVSAVWAGQRTAAPLLIYTALKRRISIMFLFCVELQLPESSLWFQTISACGVLLTVLLWQKSKQEKKVKLSYWIHLTFMKASLFFSCSSGNEFQTFPKQCRFKRHEHSYHTLSGTMFYPQA